MRHVIIGSFCGFILAAGFLAACGAAGGGGTNATVEELTRQVADLQAGMTALTARVDVHEADVNGAHFTTPYQGLNYCICLTGAFPPRNKPYAGSADGGTSLSLNPYIGHVALFAGNFAPRDWAFCHGQLLPIVQYTSLFAILGTTYGGDGTSTFALPDLRGRVPLCAGTGPGLGLPEVTLGEQGYR